MNEVKRFTFEDAAEKAGLKHRIERDFRCTWPGCRMDQTGTIVGWGLCDKHEISVWNMLDKMNEKFPIVFSNERKIHRVWNGKEYIFEYVKEPEKELTERIIEALGSEPPIKISDKTSMNPIETLVLPQRVARIKREAELVQSDLL